MSLLSELRIPRLLRRCVDFDIIYVLIGQAR
jgi:hypothetical protein